MRYALFDRPAVTIYDKAEPVERDGEGRLRSTIGDEGLYGQSCQVVGDDGGPMVQVRTFYGYPGYVRREELRFVTETELRAYLAAPCAMAARAADLLESPQVAGVPLLTVGRGARLRLAPLPAEEKPAGWTRVLLADGRAAWVWDTSLEPLRWEEDAVFAQREGLPFDDALAEALAAKKPSAAPSARRPANTSGYSTAGAAKPGTGWTARGLSATSICRTAF